ncbi:MAG: hypothetical protein U0528_12020 [Anaerolineae bacterium]
MTPAMWTGSMGYVPSPLRPPIWHEAVDLMRYLSLSVEGQRQFLSAWASIAKPDRRVEGEFAMGESPPMPMCSSNNIRKYGHNMTRMSPIPSGSTPCGRNSRPFGKAACRLIGGAEWAPQLNDILNEADQIRAIPYGNPLPQAK